MSQLAAIFSTGIVNQPIPQGGFLKSLTRYFLLITLVSFSIHAETDEAFTQSITSFVDRVVSPSETDFHLLIEEKKRQYQETFDNQLKMERAKGLLLFYFMIDDGPDVDKYANELRTVANQLNDQAHVAIAELYLGFNGEPSLTGVMTFIDQWQRALTPKLQKNTFVAIHTDLILTYAKIRPQIFPFEIQYLIQHLENIGEHPAFRAEKHMILWTLVSRGWDVEQRLEYLEAHLQHAKDNRLPIQKYILLYNMAIELVNRKYAKESVYLAEKYVAKAEAQNLPEELFFGYERLGEALSRNEHYEQANEIFQLAHPLQEYVDERWIAQINMVEAENHFYMNELEKGKAALKKAQDFFSLEGDGYRDNHNYINRVLAKQALTSGDNEAALNFYEDYIDNSLEAVAKQRLENIEGVRLSMQRLIDEARASQQLAENRLKNFQYISGILAAVILIIVWMAVRQNKTSNELKNKTIELRRLSRQDGLTKLFNRGHWEKQAKQQFENLKRYEHYQATLVLFDIDDFKSINDTYGHVIGDAVIKKVAHIIKQEIREIDIAGRYGGEEFAILFPHTNMQDTIKVTERIRAEIDQSSLEFGSQKIDFTASFGLSQYKEELKSTKEWINEADIALYASKENGKNQCTAFE